MPKSNTDIRKRGRPATGEGKPIMVRLRPDDLAKLDAWIKKHAADVSRPEAIRRIVRASRV